MKDVISDIARNVGADAAASVAPAIPEEERTFLRPEASPGGRGKRDAALALRSAEFRRGREHVWRALDEMIGRVEKRGVETLCAEEVRRLPLLYRATMSSLSVARHIALDRNLLLYLENLALRAYLVVYGPRSGVLVCLKDFFRRGFPRAVRSMLPHLTVALAALLGGPTRTRSACWCPAISRADAAPAVQGKNCSMRSCSLPGPALSTPLWSLRILCSAITPWWACSASGWGSRWVCPR